MVQESVKFAQKFALIGGVLVVGLIITWTATREAMHMAEVEAEADFRAQAELYIQRVQNRISNGLVAAQDLDNYYRAGEQIDEDTFLRLVASDTHFRENAETVGVVWQLLPSGRLDFHEAMTTLYGVNHRFDLDKLASSAQDAAPAFPFVYFWSSFGADKTEFNGRDFTSDPSIQAFFQEVALHGQPSAIALSSIDGFQLKEGRYILAANPAVSLTGNGFLIVQIINFDSLYAAAQNSELLNYDDFILCVQSRWGEGQQKLVFGGDENTEISNVTIEKDVNVGAGQWTFKVMPKLGAIHADYKAAFVTACVSLLLTGLFVFIFLSQSQRAERIASIVKRRTRALKEAHEELEDHYRLLQKMNQDVEEAKSVAELANRTKSEFLATMSHELRTPLNAILGFSQLLSEQALGEIGDPRYVEYSKDIHASGSHLLSLINDILDLAKLEAGQVKIEKNPVYVEPLVEKVINILSQQAGDKGIELYSEFSETLPECVVGDELRLRQILINLCSNAIKFTNEGSVVARLHAKRFKNGKPGWVLEVQDTGIGIPEDKQATLFDRFTQVDAALSRRHGGVGLGLAICRELVDRMEGNISVRSIPTIGTTIRVHLPLEEATAGDLEEDDQLI
ncbi:MAG: sensor histidine kinase [Kordiimonas sp.]